MSFRLFGHSKVLVRLQFDLLQLCDRIAGVFQCGERLIEAVLLDQDVIRVEGGDGKDADLVGCQLLGDPGQDTDQGEVERTLNTEGPPSVFPVGRITRYQLGRTDQRPFLIRSACEDKGLTQVDMAVIGDLAYGESHADGLNDQVLYSELKQALGFFLCRSLMGLCPEQGEVFCVAGALEAVFAHVDHPLMRSGT